MEMETRYVPTMVLLSIAVAIFASYVALNLAYSVNQAKRTAKVAWLLGGAIAMGVGIWSMHFVGMLAFEMPGMEMAYDVPLMILSVVVAIVASALTLFIVSRPVVPLPSLISGGIAMAAAISGMHYIGMYSMRMSARIEWNIPLVILSIVIALGASFAALWMSIRLRDKPDRVTLMAVASVLMGAAISGMHYVGMIAATFVHDDSLVIRESNLLVSSGLSVAVIAMTVLLLGIALMGSVGHRWMALNSKRTKQVLSTSEEKFRLLVEAVKDYAIFMLDPQGHITTWNSGAERITGYSSREVIGKHFYILHPAGKAFTKSNELGVAQERGHFEGESLHMRKDGTLFWANSVINPLLDVDGRVTGFSKVTRDITQLKESANKMRDINEQLESRVRERTLELEAREVELKTAKEAAEVANATKSAFLANMSHEIRTPLGVILGFSELMLNDHMTAEEKLNNVEVIKRNGKLLSGIINDILDLSKVEAGRLEIEMTDVHLGELVNETAQLLSLEATEKGIKINVSSDGAVPHRVKTDPMRLRQILFNIVGNAVKFTEKGSVDIKVKLAPELGPTKLAFVVQDTGAGVSPEQRHRLFAPFSQADVSTTRRFGGTGLGLVLSKKLANALGGDVVLESSQLGVGSTFVVSIDHGTLAESSVTAIDWSKKVTAPTAAGALPDLGRMPILLVDDSLDNQELLKRILELGGAVVDTACNGHEAIQKVHSGQYSVVLMDLQMPEMDGYEATRRLRADGFQLPIVAMTAHAMKEERKRCLENGFDDHMTKPVDRELLITTLAKMK